MSRIVRLPRVSTVACAAIALVTALAFGPLVRLIATAGDLDPSFGIGGVATAPSGPFAGAWAVAVQSDGKIVAAGEDEGRIRVARLHPDGSVDTGFGIGGGTSIDLGLRDFPFKVLLRPDGRIVVVASADAALNQPIVALLQYNPDGTLDSTFGAGGVAVQNLTQTLHQVHDAALQPDGGVLVVGHAFFGPAPVPYIDFTTVRFTPNGAFDLAFGAGGLLHTNIWGADEAFAIAMGPDGRFVVAGFSDTAAGARRHFAFVRYLPDGQLDLAFGTDGKTTIDPALGLAVVQSWAYDVVVQPDGRIVAAGFTEYPSGLVDGSVVRLLPDGQADTSFSDDGRAIFDDGSLGGGFGASPRGGIGRLALQANGRLLASAGNDAVLGIRPDGTLDPDFHADGLARLPGPPNDMTLQDDGNIIIASSPVVIAGPGFRVIRLMGDNTPPAFIPAAISVHRGTSQRLTIGTASDTSDPLASLVIAPVIGTLPAGLTFTNFLVSATTGAVSALATASCTTATGRFDVQFSITDGGATTFATVPVEVRESAPPTLTLADKTVNEGNASTVPAVLVLTANGPVCAAVTVPYATTDGTAVAPGDYTATSGTATIAAGQTSTTISVPVIGERVAENDETFFVTLGAPLNASIADGQGVVTIRNDDPSVVQFAEVTALDVLETDGPSPAQIVTLRLVRLGALASTAQVTFSLAGTATYGSDYVALGDGLVTFDPGQAAAELRVSILGDLLEEGTETATITIQEWFNASIGSPSAARITIRDNDGAPSDPDAPIVIGSIPVAPNAAGWHKADLSIALSATDGTGSGVKSITYALNGAHTSSATVVSGASVSISIVAEGITVVTFFAEDVAGNVAASQSLTVRLDKTAPGVVITSPQARAYTLNEASAAAYACTDAFSGVASCTGTTASGGAIDTGSVGPKTFSATAIDVAGNSATANVAYSVTAPPPMFTIRALYDPLTEHTMNSAIPIKLQVVNAAGEDVSSSALGVEALAVSSGTEIGPAEEELLADDAGQANPLGRFRFVAEGAYLFNLKTTSLKAGPYVLVVRVAGDTALHALPFVIR